MTEPLPVAGSGREPTTPLRVGIAGSAVVVAILVVGLLWAKWLPYADKGSVLSATHAWPGGSIFDLPTTAGRVSSWAGAWEFTRTYFLSVWRAALVALLVAAAVDALLPRRWLARALNRRTPWGQAAAGGGAALPSLMCTCCTAPVAVGLRRTGASVTASLAYWVGNPVLNPAVLVFLFLVAPWQLGVVRIVVGLVLVLGVTTVVAHAAGPAAAATAPAPGTEAAAVVRMRDLPVRFSRSLVRFAVVLVPEYFVVVLLTAWASRWVTDFAGLEARLGLFAVLLCAVVGTLLVIPTGGEIPIVLALVAGGVGAGVAGTLLITLPAVSLPSMVMVGRAMSWRVTVTMAAAVAATGLVSGLLLWVLL